MPLALEHLRVIDCSQGISGAVCAMQLADLGADTVKVEPPAGDWLRQIGPFQGDESEVFLQVNRNKRGMAVDLKSSGGKKVFRDLMAGADILIEGYRPGVMERLGFSYAEASDVNPGLVYCSITGHGSGGPLAGAPATELDIQAMVGMNRHLGMPASPPVRFGFDLVSYNAGMAGFQGIMAALFWRERSGQGQHVETSLLAAGIAINQWTFTGEWSPNAVEPIRSALTEAPDHGFMTADGPCLLSLRGDEEGWHKFLIAIDHPELLSDPRYSNPAALGGGRSRMAELLNDKLSKWRFEDLRRLVQDELHGTIVRANDMQTLVEDAQVQALEIVREIPGHLTLGTVKALNFPWTFDEELAALRFPAPVLGQHTVEVLSELGYAEDEVSRLLKSEAVVARAA